MNENKLLGLKIKELRSKKGLELGYKYTGKMLADELGISRSYLGDIESGRTKASDEVLQKIATVFSLSLSDLLNLDKEKVEYSYSTKDPLISEDHSNYSTLCDETSNSIKKVNTLIKENKIETLAAHFEGEEFTDEDVEDIENFINYIISKKKNK